MWLYTPFGFYSVVQKPGEEDLTVRGRVEADLDALRERYLPELGPTKVTPGHDYPCRAKSTHAALAAAMSRLVLDLELQQREVADLQGWRGRAGDGVSPGARGHDEAAQAQSDLSRR